MSANRTLALLRALSVTSALGFALVPRLAVAQTAPAAAPDATPAAAAPAVAATPSEQEEPTVLSPFVVDAAEDKGATRPTARWPERACRTDLKDVASAISRCDRAVPAGHGAKNQEDLLVYTPSTEVTGLRGNFSRRRRDRGGPRKTRFRLDDPRSRPGLGRQHARLLPDGHSVGRFDVGRVDLQRGPNSILFGTGSPAGIINVSTNGAAFTNSATTSRTASTSTARCATRVSINQQIIPACSRSACRRCRTTRSTSRPGIREHEPLLRRLPLRPEAVRQGQPHEIRGNFETRQATSANAPRDHPARRTRSRPWFSNTITTGGVTNPGYS
jgi:hypothetical protein